MLAFVINFDALHVFQSFLDDQKLRDGLIAKSVQIEEAYHKQQEKLEELKGNVDFSNDAEGTLKEIEKDTKQVQAELDV